MKESFGKYLRELREEKGIPLRKLAAILDIDQSTLSKIERDERFAKVELLPNVAEYFEIDSDELRKIYLSDKVIQTIVNEVDSEEIIDLVLEKLRYIQSKRYNQGKLNI